MGGKKLFLMTTLVILSSFVGGAFSNRLFPSKAQAINYPQKEITAQAFHLLDKNGQHRGSFGFDKDGYPILLFKNNSGSVSSYFAHESAGPMLVFRDSKENTRLALRLNKSGHPSIFFMENIKKLNFALSVRNGKDPSILFFDSESRPRLALTIQDGVPRIAFMQGKKNLDMIISTEENGNSGMIIQNQHWKVALGLINENPALMLNKTPDTGRVSGFAPDGTPLMALRENRHVTWVAPQGKQAEVENIDPTANWQSITDSLLKQPGF